MGESTRPGAAPPAPLPGSSPPLTHKEDEDKAGQGQGGPAAGHADEEAEEGVEQQRGPEQPVQECPGPPRGRHGGLGEGARPAVLLLEGVLGTEGGPYCSPQTPPGPCRLFRGPAELGVCSTPQKAPVGTELCRESRLALVHACLLPDARLTWAEDRAEARAPGWECHPHRSAGRDTRRCPEPGSRGPYRTGGVQACTSQ